MTIDAPSVPDTQVSMRIDGVDDAVLASLSGRIHIDVMVRRDGDETVADDVPVHFGHHWTPTTSASAPESGVDGTPQPTGGSETVRSSDRPEHAEPAEPVISRRAVVAMGSRVPGAEERLRAAVVTLDATPGNQVEGISPLYHAAGIDGPDESRAVVELSTRLAPHTLVGLLRSVEVGHEGAVTLRLVDMEGVSVDDDTCTIPWPPARRSAAVLAPWFDMDPDATYDGTPVSFLLAGAPDADAVGIQSDHWIIGETR